MSNVVEFQKRSVKVELTETGMYTRRRCHACGGQTEKVSILAEVPEGADFGGFRVCEECLRSGDVARRIRQHAADLHFKADELLSLAPRLEVPSWRDYLLAELHHEVEVGRRHAADEDLDADAIAAREAANTLYMKLHTGAEYYAALTEEEIIRAYGVTREQVGAAQFARAKSNQIGSELDTSIPF